MLTSYQKHKTYVDLAFIVVPTVHAFTKESSNQNLSDLLLLIFVALNLYRLVVDILRVPYISVHYVGTYYN